MYGWIFYAIALVLFFAMPLSYAWIVALFIGACFHWKYWGVGIIAFFVGAGWKNPLK